MAGRRTIADFFKFLDYVVRAQSAHSFKLQKLETNTVCWLIFHSNDRLWETLQQDTILSESFTKLIVDPYADFSVVPSVEGEEVAFKHLLPFSAVDL